MRLTILSVLVATIALPTLHGCCSPRGESVLDTEYPAQPWGIARPRIVERDGVPEAVVIDVLMNGKGHAAELYGAAFTLARRPGVVTVDGAINLNLPESEGFQAYRIDGPIMSAAEGHDPALSRVTEDHWVITIPLHSEKAKQAITEGGSIVIIPDAYGVSLGGLAFRW